VDLFKSFAGTFLLIFLAELGDKTQLAALAMTAGAEGRGRLVVFLAASLALVLSTLLAVFCGGLLTAVFPDPRLLKIAAGCLFLLFGALMLLGWL
jgi:putative Ca2+/H+ antiporter (TMEM165/GDT1 family)